MSWVRQPYIKDSAYIKGTGVVLVVHPDTICGRDSCVGEYRENVSMDYYNDHNEPVTIQNTNKG